MNELVSILASFSKAFEWWQVLVILVAYQALKTTSVLLIGRLLKPELAKIALPLVFKPGRFSGKPTDKQ